MVIANTLSSKVMNNPKLEVYKEMLDFRRLYRIGMLDQCLASKKLITHTVAHCLSAEI